MSAADDDERMEQVVSGEAAVFCLLCGASAARPPLSWMFENDSRRGARWYCEDCARQHLRAVEAKLDEEWW